MASYQQVILQAVLLFPIIALLFSLPYMIHNYHKYGSFLSMRIAIVYSFILYLICIYFLVILPLPSIESVANLSSSRVQLLPFQFIQDILVSTPFVWNDPTTYLAALNTSSIYQVLLNVAMFIPFGMYLRYYFKCSLKKTLLLSFLLSLFFELTQLSGLYFIYPRSYRLFDVDDLLINTLGGIIGYGIITPFLKVLPSRDEIDIASFKRGMQVSFPRRTLALLIDFVIILIIDSFVSWVVYNLNIPFTHTLSIITLLYFIASTILAKGYTVGKRITKTRITSTREEQVKWYQYILRYLSLYMLIDVIPLLLSTYLNQQYEANHLHLNTYILLSALLFAVVVIYLLFASIEIATHKSLYYERLSKTKIISTILYHEKATFKTSENQIDDSTKSTNESPKETSIVIEDKDESIQ